MTEPLSATQALAIVEHCPLPVLVLDARGQLSACNTAFTRLLDPSRMDDVPEKAVPARGDYPLQALLAAGTGERVSWTDPRDRQHHFEIHRVALPGSDQAQALYLVDISRQVALEQSRDTLNAQLEQQSLTDPLTGLLNQRGAMLALEPQVARSRRYNNPMSVIMLAGQHLAEQEGLLLKAAQMLKDQLRWADLISCTENSDFVVVLPETGHEPALQLAEKLAQRLQELHPERPDPHQTVCFGIASWRRNDNAGTLLRRAGLALSQARNEQGDRPMAS